MKKKIKWILYAVILLLFVFALLQFDAQSLLDSLKQIPLWLMGLLLGIQIVTQFLMNIQWQAIAKFADTPISLRDMFYINSQGAVMDSITPGVKFGGEVTRAVQLSRIGKCSGEQAAAVVAMQKLFSLGSFFFINLFAVGFLIGKTPLLQAIYLQALIFGVLIIFLSLFISVFLIPHRMRTYLQNKKDPRFSWMRKLKSFMLTLLSQVILIRKRKKLWLSLLLLSVFIWLLYPLKMYLLVMQVLPGVNIFFVAAATFLAYIVAMLPIFPGGLGGFEGTMTGLLLTMGFVASDALAITVIFRFITFWFVMLFGLAFIAFCKVRSFNAPCEARLKIEN